MQTIQTTKSSGIGSNALHTWGMLFAAIGIAARSILQIRLLGMGQVSAQALLEVLRTSDSAMFTATAALVMQGWKPAPCLFSRFCSPRAIRKPRTSGSMCCGFLPWHW